MWRLSKWYVVPFVFWLMVSTIFILVTDKHAMFLQINQWHHPILDSAFVIITQFAEWWGVVLVLFSGFLLRIKWGILATFAFLVSGGLSILLKIWVFPDFARPSSVFGAESLHTIEGVDLHAMHAFPSGHTTTAFALSICLAYYAGQKRGGVAFFWFITALLVGFSRIYLAQHFPQDVWAGSLLGVVASILVFYMGERLFNRLTLHWPEKSFLALFHKLH